MKNIQSKLLVFAVFIVAVSFLPNILNFATNVKSPKDGSIEKQEQETLTEKEPDYSTGKVVFDNLKNRVCEELDLCWVAGGYTINGDKILKKRFPTYWGSKRTLIIPNEEWINLSAADKKDLGEYLKHIGVDEIIVGKVKPAEFSDGTINPDRNVLTVDETVWSSNN
jgi:hypothetical protein